MSNYTITTDFGAKDSLPSSNSAKVVRGSEFTTEFTNIQTAIATKADTAGDTFTGVVNFSDDVAVNTNTLFVDVSEAKVLVGKTSDDNTTNGLVVNSNGYTKIVRTSGTENANTVLMLNRKSTDGAIAEFRKDDAVVGSIGTSGSRPYFSNNVNDGIKIADDYVAPCNQTGADKDASLDLGSSSVRFKDLHLSGTGYFGTSVGIGTTSPATALHIDSSGATALTLQRNSGASSNISIKYDGVSQDYYTGVASVSEDFVIGTSADLNGNNLLRVTSAGNVGIGTTNPIRALHVNSGNDTIRLQSTSTNTKIEMVNTGSTTNEFGFLSNNFFVSPDGTERMRIDSSGRLLVGTTDTSIYDNTSGGNTGFVYSPNHLLQVARETTTSTQSVMNLNKMGSDGNIIEFYKDGSQAGSIGTIGGEIYIESGDVGLQFDASGNDIVPYGGGFKDATIDLGSSANRFKDIYRSGSTYSTSDRNKKQDIRDLTDAEARVATVAKGSLKAFRYIDSVEAEGDEANIHFGIIAQDLKAAFEAEGLNANDYQVFKTSTYTDDDGVEQTTYSICYENLLAFIIAAI